MEFFIFFLNGLKWPRITFLRNNSSPWNVFKYKSKLNGKNAEFSYFEALKNNISMNEKSDV